MGAMDLKSTQGSPVVADVAPMDNSRLCIHSGLFTSSQSVPSFSTSAISIPRKKPEKIDDVCCNGWLDAMISSSPPCKRLKDANVDVDSDDDVTYRAWMKEYPSALKSFEKIMNRARNRKIVMFLDYDGTLSPIVDDPDHAFMSDEMRYAVQSVAKYFPTAIISGRSRSKVFELVGLRELFYAGSHGMDIMLPVRDSIGTNYCSCITSSNKLDEVNLFQPADEFLPMIDEVFRVLVENTKDITGSRVENHKFCASVHYRKVDDKIWPLVAQRVHDVLDDYPRLQVTHGRKVLEVRPAIDWDKGKAVEFLLESLGLSSSDDVLPIYIGDDRTDEDAFEVVVAKGLHVLSEGNRGYGILVSSVPKESKALFSLKDPSEVREFLEALVRVKEQDALC